MKIATVFFPAFFILFSLNIRAQQEIAINYYKPYQYDAAKNTVKAWIDQRGLGQDFTVSLDGKTLNYAKTDSGRVELILPLAGNGGEMSIFSSTRSSGWSDCQTAIQAAGTG